MSIELPNVPSTESFPDEPDLEVARHNRAPGSSQHLSVKAVKAKDPGSGLTCEYYDPEDREFWSTYGRRIAQRNLLWSIPNLLLAFAIWLVWSVIATKMQKVHDKDPGIYSFSDVLDTDASDYNSQWKSLVTALPACAGLSGATLRVPNSFMVALVGGRTIIYLTTILLLVPMALAGVALGRSDVSFAELAVYAMLSGVGGGAFSSSMSNISYFYPKKEQGLALGLNAGLGNIGVAITQLIAPIAMGGSMGLGANARAGAFVQNAAWMWMPLLVVCILGAFFCMNNLPVSANSGHYRSFFQLASIGYMASGVAVALLVVTAGRDAFSHPAASVLRVFVLALVAIGAQMLLLKYATPALIAPKIDAQFAIFSNKHTWIMTYLYVMTFGTFIGFSVAFPKLILDLFGYEADGVTTRDGAPDPLDFAWLGAFVGSITRPVGGWLADKYGGAMVTHWSTIGMVASTLVVGVVVQEADGSSDPDAWFPWFLLGFLLLFASSGVANGSTFKQVPAIWNSSPDFDSTQTGPVLGWIAACAAYGAFVIPSIFGIAIEDSMAHVAFYGMTAYYFSCLLVNWHYYAKPNAEAPC